MKACPTEEPSEGRTQGPRCHDQLAEAEALQQKAVLFDIAEDLLVVCGFDGIFRLVNGAFASTLTVTPDELVSRPFIEFVHEEDRERTLDEMKNLGAGQPVLRFENRYQCSDGSYKWLSWKAVPRADLGYIYAVAREVSDKKQEEELVRQNRLELERRVEQRTADLAHAVNKLEREVAWRKRVEEQALRNVRRLEALRKIDLAILGSVDVGIVLDAFLQQVVDQLGVDAAAVLLLNSQTGLLQFAAGRGFRTNTIKNSKIRLSSGLAGRAAVERRVVEALDLSEHKDFSRPEVVQSEQLVSYIGVPLIAKGKVCGVLDICHRSRLAPDEDWHSFLHALAGQAAIAIDSATMFSDLQRSTTELLVSYDATLEGWVKALDLKDHETEGHSVRVTDLTMELAQEMGVPDHLMGHIRRGALLHDIGKIGVPDAILLKEGPLTHEERLAMQKHPVYAYEWLSPIKFLSGAIDIPYCHHEKWDGTGYPRGLQGASIPLAARMFAIVDVWDALTSDRPYRKAWSAPESLAYISNAAGTHFDPDVVSAFMKLVRANGLGQ